LLGRLQLRDQVTAAHESNTATGRRRPAEGQAARRLQLDSPSRVLVEAQNVLDDKDVADRAVGRDVRPQQLGMSVTVQVEDRWRVVTTLVEQVDVPVAVGQDGRAFILPVLVDEHHRPHIFLAALAAVNPPKECDLRLR